MSNKRNHTRVNVERSLQILLSDGTRVNAVMNNICCGGVGILYPESSKLGTQFKIRFSLAGDEYNVVITEKVTVVHSHFRHELYPNRAAI